MINSRRTAHPLQRALLADQVTLVQGSRCREGLGFSVVMVASGRTRPLQLSATSTSTGANNLSENGPIAPVSAVNKRTSLNKFLKYFGYEGRHRRMAIELPKSSAHLLPAASVPYARPPVIAIISVA